MTSILTSNSKQQYTFDNNWLNVKQLIAAKQIKKVSMNYKTINSQFFNLLAKKKLQIIYEYILFPGS